MIYLASPFTDPDENVEKQRYMKAFLFTANHMASNKRPIFSPIVYGYNFYKTDYVGGTKEAWQFFNDNMIKLSSQVWVLTLPGWDNSRGVGHEILKASELNIPIEYVE